MPDSPRRAVWLAVVALCFIQFVDVFGVTVVVAALPSMLADVGAPQSAAALVVTGYAMFFGGLLMFGARLGDHVGHRRVMLLGLSAFGAGALLGATAGSVLMLVAARCAQGAAAALSVPSALRLLSAVTREGTQRRRAIAGWSASGAAAGATGLVLGGLLTTSLSWRATFWLNVPLAVLLALAIWVTVPPVDDIRLTERPAASSALLLTAGLMGLVLGSSLVQLPALWPAGIGVALVGGLLLVVFARTDRRALSPLIPSAAVRNANLRRGAAAAFLNTATTSSAIILATLYLQQAKGISPVAAGFTLLPFSLSVVGGSALAAPLLRRRRPGELIRIGLGTIAAGILPMSAAPAATVLVPIGAAIAGLGIGVASVGATTLGTDVPSELQGAAAGVLNTSAQVGTALGVAAILLLSSAAGAALGLSTGATLGWLSAALIAVIGALGGRWLIPPPTRWGGAESGPNTLG